MEILEIHPGGLFGYFWRFKKIHGPARLPRPASKLWGTRRRREAVRTDASACSISPQTVRIGRISGFCDQSLPASN